MNGPMYIEQLEYITAVTRVLNENMPDCPAEVGYYVRVELIENDTHRPVGRWSDEIANDCWAYDEMPKPREGNAP